MEGDRLLGVRIGRRSLTELVQDGEAAISGTGGPFVFACANPHSLVVARADGEFREALEQASVVVADGVGCRWGAALSGVAIGPRITGTDYFLAVMRTLERSAGKAFFFGSSEAVLCKVRSRIQRDFPSIRIRTLSPPFRSWSAQENGQMIEEIRAFAPDVLWVGMTAPKQEKWVAANCRAVAVPLIGSIGAVFDYYAGVTQRAPDWICRIGLEWLYRLPREPKRLWRRTFLSAPAFLWYALLDRVRH